MKRVLILLAVTGLVAGCVTTRDKAGIEKIPPESGGGKTMSTMLAVRTLSVSIECPPDKVYDFVANPENLPKWANGLGSSVTKTDGGWLVETPRGPVTVRFAERNGFGVLDHYVTVAPGVEVYVPLRVIANGSGSEVLFTLFRLPDMTDEKFAEDRKLVEQDLGTLKNLLEERSSCL